MPSNHLILCHPLLLLPSIFPSIRVFSTESALSTRWPKYWSFILFNGWVIFHCIHVPHLLYLVLCQWTFRLLPCLGCCKQWCNEHGGEASVSFKSPAGDANMQMNESHGSREAMDTVGKDIWADLVDKIHPPEKPKEGYLALAPDEVKTSQVAQLCLTLFDPMDCSLPGSSHGIFQARVLERVAISFSRGSSPPRDQTRVSCIVGRRFTIWATREVSSTWTLL